MLHCTQELAPVKPVVLLDLRFDDPPVSDPTKGFQVNWKKKTCLDGRQSSVILPQVWLIASLGSNLV